VSDQKTRLERIKTGIHNHKLFSVVIVLGSIVTGISAFTNATTNLIEFVTQEERERPAINGEWKAEVTYDWPNARYAETFDLHGDGDNVYGTASFLGLQRGILDGVVKDNKIEFITRTMESAGNSTAELIHRYQGKVSPGEIRFVMQTEGGSSPRGPVEFVASRTPAGSSGQSN